MAAIEDLKTWQYYCEFLRPLLYDWREIRKIPEGYQALFEKPLTIKDLSHEVVFNLFYISATAVTGEYKIDKDNKKAIEMIVQYIRQDDEFLNINPSYSFKKGILLHGPVGTGKTALFKTLQRMLSGLVFYHPSNECRQSFASGQYKIVSANEITRLFSVKGNEIFTDGSRYKELIRDSICIDDFGSEPEATHFGQKTNIIGEIIQERYEKRSLTHVSTNLNASAIKEAYGLRVADRMREMFNDIPLIGNSRRK